MNAGPLADRTGYRALHLMQKYAAPAAIRAAEPTALDALPIISNFADRAQTYPLHTPAAAWASAAAYHDAGDTNVETGNRIKAACVEHRLRGEWERLQKAAAAAREAARIEPPWALPEQKKYPLGTPGQIKAAVDYFARYADSLSVADRKTYAGALVKFAGAYANDETMSRWEAEAGLAQPAADPLLAFRMRAQLTSDPTLRDALTKVASVPDPHEAAALLRRVDKRAGFNLSDPIIHLTGLTPTQARSKLAGLVKAASGNWYAAADLDRVPDALLQDLFGAPPIVSRRYREQLLAKVAAFERVAEDHGVRPLERARRPRVDWASLASGAA